MDVTPVFAHGSTQAHDSATSTSALPNSQGLNDMFLQLLVAQLQHQSPLEPMDPTQFVGQLAQFSELSEVTQINQLLQKELATKTAAHDDSVSADNGRASPKSVTDAIPEAMISSAVQAARAANPELSPISAMPNHAIEGVF
jgi:flagellar basal-body rod modification protein FlgD